MRVSPSIILAIVIGALMVATSFFLAQNKENTPSSLTKEDASDTNKPPVRSFISTLDSDQNNIPDWQEELVGVTVNLNETTTTSPTLVGDLTNELASRVASGVDDTSATTDELRLNLTEQIIDRQYTRDDIVTREDNSANALRIYGNAVAVIANSGTLPEGTDTPLNILRQYFSSKEPETLEELKPHIEAYQKMVDSTLRTPVPSSLVREHLSLINVYNALLIDLTDFKKVDQDALAAMLRMQRYTADTTALYTAISNLYLKLHRNGIEWGGSDAASKFIKIE